MKKPIILLPLLGLLLSGCNFSDIISFGSKQSENTEQKTSEKQEENNTEEKPSNEDNTPSTNAKTIISIQVISCPASINKGETLSTSSVTLVVRYSDGTTENANPTAIVLNTSAEAENVVGTAYYNEFSATFTINVVEQASSEIKTIAEVKQYIAEHPVEKNEFGNGVNNSVSVTIQGFALAKIDLVKTKASFGLNVSAPGKIIIGDSTGVIAAASVTGNGANLWTKVNDHQCKETSKYTVTGYISEYLGHPEIYVTSYSWDENLDLTWSTNSWSEEQISLTQFYEKSVNVNYNCAGHGYGGVVTVSNIKCYYSESDGSGKRYYNFTDGTKNIRVNAYNLGSVSVGSIYNVTGIISLKNLSPIIVAFNISLATNPTPVNLDYASVATNISIANLKKIHGDQDDTSTKYPAVVNAYGEIFKTTGYLTAVLEDGKYYIGISDTYYSSALSGKTNTMSSKDVSLIKNENFWNTTLEELYLFNPLFDDYVLEEQQITVYYVVRQLSYQSKKPMWEILLLPDFVESLKSAE